jgi:hypothetical protein
VQNNLEFNLKYSTVKYHPKSLLFQTILLTNLNLIFFQKNCLEKKNSICLQIKEILVYPFFYFLHSKKCLYYYLNPSTKVSNCLNYLNYYLNYYYFNYYYLYLNLNYSDSKTIIINSSFYPFYQPFPYPLNSIPNPYKAPNPMYLLLYKAKKSIKESYYL